MNLVFLAFLPLGRQMSAKSVANGRRVNPVVAPPQQYMMVDTSLHRAVLPFTRYNLLFLHVQGIDTFFNLSTSPLHETILEFADAKDISVLNTARMGDTMEGHNDSPSDDGRDGGLLPILSDLQLAGDWIRDTLVTLLTLTRDCKVLLISDSNICIDAIVLACSRRLQQWSATAWLSEFRFLAGRDLSDVEQFIESVDLSPLQGIVEGGNTPAFMRTYTEARRREESAVSEGQWKLWGLGPSVDGKKRAVYERLLLHGSHRVTSKGMVFNANLSLINEKDEEVD